MLDYLKVHAIWYPEKDQYLIIVHGEVVEGNDLKTLQGSNWLNDKVKFCINKSIGRVISAKNRLD